MFTRFILTLIFSLISGVQAWACDCAPWSGGYVSEFAKSHVSVWAVPTEAKVNIEHLGNPSGGVTYNLEVLEGFDRINQSKISVFSNVADGGSCGVQLTLGVPQFINVYKYDIEKYGISDCTPNLPYNALKNYLETGQDSFIPEWLMCHSWSEKSSKYTPVFNDECAVWKGADHIDGFYGAQDSRKYNKIWWEKVEAINAEPKKKRRWWSFKKD